MTRSKLRKPAEPLRPDALRRTLSPEVAPLDEDAPISLAVAGLALAGLIVALALAARVLDYLGN